MSISSLVVDLDPAGDALTRLAQDPRITLGPRHGNRQALVVETASIAEDTDLYASLQRLPGIRLVTLVAAYLDDAPVPAGVGPAHL
jgi:hypothetical protein